MITGRSSKLRMRPTVVTAQEPQKTPTQNGNKDNTAEVCYQASSICGEASVATLSWSTRWRSLFSSRILSLGSAMIGGTPTGGAVLLSLARALISMSLIQSSRTGFVRMLWQRNERQKGVNRCRRTYRSAPAAIYSF